MSVRLPIRRLHRAPEAGCVAALVDAVRLDPAAAGAALQTAERLTAALRARHRQSGGVGALMHEFSLSSQEGVALMCLAEALLRIPDAATADALIRDKLAAGDWRAHIGRGRSLFVNAAAWGLMISGSLRRLGLPRSVYIEKRHYAEFETGNLTLSVYNAEKMGLEHRVNPNAVALHVDDVASARRALEERGVRFQGDTFDTGVCHMASFSDPDGNALMLHHRYAPRVTES